jgi:hypothetical protein
MNTDKSGGICRGVSIHSNKNSKKPDPHFNPDFASRCDVSRWRYTVVRLIGAGYPPALAAEICSIILGSPLDQGGSQDG